MLSETSETLKQIFKDRNKRSHNAFKKAQNILPGGSTREIIFHKPYPLYIRKGKGCWIQDIDGHRILDFLNNYTSLILGHAHPKIVEAIKSQIINGTSFSAPTEHEQILGTAINERIPSIESIRFTNSGSEATSLSILAAKAFTGNKKIAKFEGAYHGTNENTMVSTNPSLKDAGPKEKPNSVPDGPHIQPNILENTIILPFNKQRTCEKLLYQNREELAAIIVEPVLGSAGIIPPKEGFMQFLGEITEKNNILLIFDEVVTGFRISRGGAQEKYRVKPDLTALGKNIGAGFPLGAFGGRKDIMAQFEPTRENRIHHSGSLNANPVSLKAGLTLLEELTNENYRKLSEQTSNVVRGLEKIFSEQRIDAKITQSGSLFVVHFTSEKVIDYRSAMKEDTVRKFNFFLGMLLNGVMIAPRGLGCISTPMSNRDIDIFLQKVVESTIYLKER